MSLQLQAIDRLFDRLASTYGGEWVRKWDGVEAVAVKSMWAHELAGFAKNLKAIAWALENLPERCPNLIEFRNLCRSAPVPEVRMLPEPKADPARVAAEFAKLGNIIASDKPAHGMKDWAYRLKARDERGEKLSGYQRRCYQAALREFA